QGRLNFPQVGSHFGRLSIPERPGPPKQRPVFEAAPQLNASIGHEDNFTPDDSVAAFRLSAHQSAERVRLRKRIRIEDPDEIPGGVGGGDAEIYAAAISAVLARPENSHHAPVRAKMETLAFRSAQSIIPLAVSRDHPRDVGQFPDIAIEGLMAAVLTDNDAELSVDRVLERPEAAHKVLGLVCRDNRNDNARGGANCVRDFRHSTPLPIGQSRMPSETLFAKCR